MTPELFECADGTLINKNNVTHCELVRSEGYFIVRFNFVGGTMKEVLFNNETKAQNQKHQYKMEE